MKICLPSQNKMESSMPRGAKQIDLPSSGTWSDFLNRTNEGKRLGYEKSDPGEERVEGQHQESIQR